MTDMERRLRAALDASARTAVGDDERMPVLATSPVLRPVGPRPWIAPLLAAAAVAGLAIGTAALVSSPQARPPAVPSSPSSSFSSSTASSASSIRPVSPTAVVSPTVTTRVPASSPPPTSTTVVPGPMLRGNQPLWPFPSFEAAEDWRQAGQGSQPWHLSADDTALNFTRGFLGFTDIDRVTSSSVVGDDAHIGVGYISENGRPFTAAVLHLIKFGPYADSPWEVVGSDDTTLTIEQPRYGSSVSSPVTVGGRISGVDESIRVWVRQSGRSEPLGSAPGVPGGGQNQPWSTTVSFSGAESGAITIVAATGGHLQDVERFAIHAAVVG